MKKTVRIILILLLMLLTVLTFAYVGMMHWFGTSSDHHVSGADAGAVSAHEPDSDGKRLALPDGDIVLQVGQSRQCAASLEDGSSAEGVFWSSTNEKVASVDNSGRVTAVAAGEAELLAVLGRDNKARVKVSVYENMTAAAVEAVKALAADGSDESMEHVESMLQSLSHASDKESSETAAVLKAVSDFKSAGEEGSGTASQLWEALTAAVSASEMALDEQTLRQAVLAAYSQGEKQSSDLTISFTGDCTFAHFNELDTTARFPSVYENSGSITYPFDLTRQVFGADDITMINFEGTLTDATEHRRKKFFFRGKPEYVNILTHSSVEAVTVENNHSFDYLDTGYNDTIDNLKKAGIIYTNYYTPAVINVRDFRVVMLSLCLVDTQYSDEFREQIERYISQYKRNDTVIVMNIHWGIEMDEVPGKDQIEIAHAMIDSGIDMIIGHHPHVPQGIELYNGHYIFYSLGNFSFGGNSKAKKPDTLIVRTMYKKDDAGHPVLDRLSIVPCLTTSTGGQINNYRPTPLYGKRGQAGIDRLVWLSSYLDNGVKSLSWSMIP